MQSLSPEVKKYRILITGFVEDLNHKDYSWAVAKSMQAMKWPSNIWVEIRDLTYSYQSVKSQIEYLFLAFRPDLLIHLHFDISSGHITVEKCSFNRSYRIKDVFEAIPDKRCAIEGGVGRLETKLTIEPLCKKGEDYCKARNLGSKLKCVPSKYPGESVAAYLYYLTLNYDSKKTLLVHIPSVKSFTSREINYALKGIILEALKQL